METLLAHADVISKSEHKSVCMCKNAIGNLQGSFQRQPIHRCPVDFENFEPLMEFGTLKIPRSTHALCHYWHNLHIFWVPVTWKYLTCLSKLNWKRKRTQDYNFVHWCHSRLHFSLLCSRRSICRICLISHQIWSWKLQIRSVWLFLPYSFEIKSKIYLVSVLYSFD